MIIAKILNKAFLLSFFVMGAYFLLALIIILLDLFSVFQILIIIGLLIVFMVAVIGIAKFTFWLLFKNPETENECQSTMENKYNSKSLELRWKYLNFTNGKLPISQGANQTEYIKQGNNKSNTYAKSLNHANTISQGKNDNNHDESEPFARLMFYNFITS
jgi:hypothetical protein